MSVAVTVILALPFLTARMVTVLPDALAVAMLIVEDRAEYVSVSPSGSLNFPETLIENVEIKSR